MLLVAYCSFLFMCTKVGTHKKRLLFREVQAGNLFLCFCNAHYNFRSCFIQPFVSFWRVCCLWDRFFLSALLRLFPVPVRVFRLYFLAPPPDFYTAAAKKRLECVTIHKPWQHEGTSSGCIEKYPFVCMYRCKSFSVRLSMFTPGLISRNVI